MATTVVYVHGLWMAGFEGALLRRRMARGLPARAPLFRYRSVTADLSANARTLAAFLSRLGSDTLHLVGHSLGGLVILKLFEDGGAAALPPGRIVLLGSPVCGSRAAQAMSTWRIGRSVLGQSVSDSLLATVSPAWGRNRDLGVIAGNLNVGLGRLINSHQGPSDGTVYVDETHLTGAKDQVVLRVSHTGLPLSSAVAEHTIRFLRDGTF